MLNVYGWKVILRGFVVLYFVCGLFLIVFVLLDKFKEDIIYSKLIKESSWLKKIGNLFFYRNCFFLVLLFFFIVVYFSYFILFVYIVSSNFNY